MLTRCFPIIKLYTVFQPCSMYLLICSTRHLWYVRVDKRTFLLICIMQSMTPLSSIVFLCLLFVCLFVCFLLLSTVACISCFLTQSGAPPVSILWWKFLSCCLCLVYCIWVLVLTLVGEKSCDSGLGLFMLSLSVLGISSVQPVDGLSCIWS